MGDTLKPLARTRALTVIREGGRALARRMPQISLSRPAIPYRTLIVTLEVIGGLMLFALVAVVAIHVRLKQGPIPLTFLISPIENAVNRELAGVDLRIRNAILRRSDSGAGIEFRLQDVRLVDRRDGAIVARAPLAAITLSGPALLTGRIAPGRVDFINPRILLFYSEKAGFSVSFSRPEAGAEPSAAAPETAPRSGVAETIFPKPAPGAERTPLRRLDLARALADAFARARKHRSASSYLTAFGVRNALVILDYRGRQNFWQVPRLQLNLRHRQKRSIIEAEADLRSSAGPWSLRLRAEESEKQKRLTIDVAVADLVPRGLVAAGGMFAPLASFDMPITGKARFVLSTTGEMQGAQAEIALAAGHVRFAGPWPAHLLLDEGIVRLRYRADAGVIELLPSTVFWGRNRATISGTAALKTDDGGTAAWDIRLKARDVAFAADAFSVPPANVEVWRLAGRLDPAARTLTIGEFFVRAGGAELLLAGRVRAGEGSPAVFLEGAIGSMPVATLKRLWPRFIAPEVRDWVGKHVRGGQLTAGRIRLDMPAGLIARIEAGAPIPNEAVEMVVTGERMVIQPFETMPPLEAPRITMEIVGRRFSLDVPEARANFPNAGPIAFSAGRFVIPDMAPDDPMSEVSFRAKGTAKAALALAQRPPIGFRGLGDLSASGVEGEVDGTFRIAWPLREADEPLTLADMSMSGKAVLHDAGVRKTLGDIRLHGGELVLALSEKALDLRGDVLLNGIAAKLTWQRIFGAPEERQPALRISGVFDDADREQLGLFVNHMVRGEVPVFLSISLGAEPGGRRAAHDHGPALTLRAELTNAELILENLAWRKPPGRAATLEFEIVRRPDGLTELRDFKIVGDDIAIDGWVSLDAQNRLKSFVFPDFSFNVITHLRLEGEIGDDRIWKVKAEGMTYDGRGLFRSLFSAGQLTDRALPKPRDRLGIDVEARIDTLVGFSQTVLKNVRVSLSKRERKLTALAARGVFENGKDLSVRLVDEPGNPRVLMAESDDAGAAFRLVGFYPRIHGGIARLRVNLDGKGLAEKTGLLAAQNFVVLGDPVVTEVLSASSEDTGLSGGETPSQGRRGKRVVRSQLAFDRMRVRFSVGQGQFVLHEALINGPVLGATMRGKVDFNRQSVRLGGTYVPLYGLNSALGQLPIIGPLLVGRRGEGLLGITFAIQGAMANPQVIVNPISAVAPGIFRQIFEFSGPGQRVLPRPAPARGRRPGPQASSSTPVLRPESWKTRTDGR